MHPRKIADDIEAMEEEGMDEDDIVDGLCRKLDIPVLPGIPDFELEGEDARVTRTPVAEYKFGDESDLDVSDEELAA